MSASSWEMSSVLSSEILASPYPSRKGPDRPFFAYYRRSGALTFHVSVNIAGGKAGRNRLYVTITYDYVCDTVMSFVVIELCLMIFDFSGAQWWGWLVATGCGTLA